MGASTVYCVLCRIISSEMAAVDESSPALFHIAELTELPLYWMPYCTAACQKEKVFNP